MRINNNASAFSVFKYYERSTQSLQRSMEHLSSGLRIVRPGDDAAGLAISEKFRAQVNNTGMAVSNVQDMIGMIQTMDGWMQNISDMLNRMNELAVESLDGTKSTADIANLETEYNQLQSEIQSITTGSTARGKYNTINLFSNSTTVIQVGPDYNQTFTRASLDLTAANSTAIETYQGLAVNWADIINTANSINANDSDDAMRRLFVGIKHIAKQRATLGAYQNRLEYTMEGLRNYQENIGKAESIIRDVDVANETTKFTRHQILVQTGTAMLAQANAVPQSVLALIGK